MGQSYRVFPATLVQEQVLHNNLGKTFLPAEEIEASVDAWNKIPVVLRHPSRRGMPVSARDPDVLEQRGVGEVFRARFEDGALKGEVWISEQRLRDLDEAADVVNRVERGEPGELSTGFATAVENEGGVHNGESFDKTLRNIGPDHLALLVEEKGACSVEDGCGLGVNHQGPCECEEDDVDEQKVAESIWGRLRAFLTSHNSEEIAMDRERVIATLVDAGCPLSEERLAELEDAELEALQAFHADEGGEPEPTTEDGEAADALLEEIESLRAELAEVRESAKPAIEERERERADLVRRLADNERVAFDEEELEGMTVTQLQKVARTAQVRSYAGRGGPSEPTDTAELQFIPPRPYWEDDGEES